MSIGASIGPYRVLSHLGSGGMGAVWLAEDTRLNRQVALKMVRPADTDDAAARARLMREARAAAALNHPHIATVHDVLEADGQVVIVFEYVEGETLHARISRGRVPAPEAVDIASQIAKALAAAHAQGIVHRDLKPANVIIGAGGHVKVLDFGVARMLSLGTTQTRAGSGQASTSIGLVGTAAYAAPEQMVTGAVDQRADLYALGVVLFEMICGRRPFTSTDAVQLASSKLGKDAPRLSSTGQLVPLPLERVVGALLARDPDQRPDSAADVLAELRAIYGTPSTASFMVRGRRGRLLAAAAAVVVLALAGAGIWQLRPLTPSPSTPPVVAVLPLANISGDASRDHVAAGIAESLISSLASLPSITVLSRAAVVEARGRVKDEAALAKDLGATYLVNGSVQESGGTLKISLNLVKPDRTVAWGDSVEGSFSRIFDLQSRLATSLTTALVVRVSASERERMNAQPTASPEALAAYWRGQALVDRRDVRGNIQAAIGAFGDAVALDPKFALAHAALGQAYWMQYLETRDPSWAEHAADAGFTALRLDAGEPAVRYTLAVTLAGTGKLDEAVAELRQALSIRPNYDDARRQLGIILASQGHIDEAVGEFNKAIAARPQFWGHYSAMGRSLFGAARYDDAAAAFARALELQPDNTIVHQQLGATYQQLGKNDLALSTYQRSIAIQPTAPAYSNVGMLHHLKGDYTEAVDAYRRAIELRPNVAGTHRNLGDALARLGRRDEALESYRRAVALIENDLKVNARDPLLLASAAVYLQKAGRGAEAQKRMQLAVQIAPADNQVLYRSAMVHALAGRSAEALSALQKAIANGYSRAAAAQDDEFESIRGRREFLALVAPGGAGESNR